MLGQESDGLFKNFDVLFETGNNKDMSWEVVCFFGIKGASLLHDLGEPKVINNASNGHGEDDE